MNDFIQVTTTTATEADARRIATTLVEQRLAACVQIEGPLESVYWWQGQIEQTQEWRCTVKTRSSLFESVAQTIGRLHPYECPEILATPIVACNEAYLDWLKEQLADA
jgi:periplasmic divalent cation tolerance protein